MFGLNPRILRRFLLFNFRVVHRVDQWAKRRFTHAGLLVLVGMGTAAVFGIDLSATFGLQLATFGAALLFVAICSAPFFRGRFRLQR